MMIKDSIKVCKNYQIHFHHYFYIQNLKLDELVEILELNSDLHLNNRRIPMDRDNMTSIVQTISKQALEVSVGRTSRGGWTPMGGTAVISEELTRMGHCGDQKMSQNCYPRTKCYLERKIELTVISIYGKLSNYLMRREYMRHQT